MTYNTGNAIGSHDPRDLYDNAENLDKFANGAAPNYPDRLGASRKSWKGMEQDFQDFLAASGYHDLGAYGAGLNITARNQVFLKDGEYYRVAAGVALPYTTTGTWPGESTSFVGVGDAVLRQDLGAENDPAKGATIVGYRGRNVFQRLSEFLFVQDYGAVGDGIADDTASIQAAVAGAAAAGKWLFFPAGTYKVTGISLPSGTRMLGMGAILKLAASTNASLLVNSDPVGGNTRIHIEGIELDGNKANQGAISRPVALFKKCTYVTLRHVTAHDAKITTYTTDTYNQVLFVDCWDCVVEHCESYNSDQGGLGFYGTGGRHRVEHNYVHDCPAGIEGAYQTDSRVAHNHVRSSTVALISWSGLRNTIEDNLCVGSSAGAGIVCGHSGTPNQVANGSWVRKNTIQDVYSYGVTVFSSQDVTVEGNKITRVSGDSSHSIFINTGCTRVYVRDNVVQDGVTSAAGASGIFVDGCSDLEVVNNRVFSATGGTTGNGIRLFNACPNALVEGNTVVSSAGNGINISEASSPNATIANNKVRSSGGVGIRTLGDGSVISGNTVTATAGAQGILVNANQCAVNGNRVSGVTAGQGLNFNAFDYCAAVGNIFDNCLVGIQVPSGSDYNLEVANVFTSTVTTPISIGTVTGNKAAHNIGAATHDV